MCRPSSLGPGQSSRLCLSPQPSPLSWTTPGVSLPARSPTKSCPGVPRTEHRPDPEGLVPGFRTPYGRSLQSPIPDHGGALAPSTGGSPTPKVHPRTVEPPSARPGVSIVLDESVSFSVRDLPEMILWVPHRRNSDSLLIRVHTPRREFLVLPKSSCSEVRVWRPPAPEPSNPAPELPPPRSTSRTIFAFPTFRNRWVRSLKGRGRVRGMGLFVLKQVPDHGDFVLLPAEVTWRVLARGSRAWEATPYPFLLSSSYGR